MHKPNAPLPLSYVQHVKNILLLVFNFNTFWQIIFFLKALLVVLITVFFKYSILFTYLFCLCFLKWNRVKMCNGKIVSCLLVFLGKPSEFSQIYLYSGLVEKKDWKKKTKTKIAITARSSTKTKWKMSYLE